MFTDSIEIKIEQFEGPLDLLLYLIKKNEIDIYDIPIVRITQEYLDVIEKMQELKIDVASDYIVMAATLIKIKSDMLLPRNDADENVDDPRRPLVDKLLEYQKIKKASEIFREIESEAQKLFGRTLIIEMPVKVEEEELTLIDLMEAFTPMLKKGLSLTSYRMPKVRKSITEKISELTEELARNGRISFSEYITSFDSAFEIVLSFVAMLEMIQKGIIKVRQEEQFAEIWIELA